MSNDHLGTAYKDGIGSYDTVMIEARSVLDRHVEDDEDCSICQPSTWPCQSVRVASALIQMHEDLTYALVDSGSRVAKLLAEIEAEEANERRIAQEASYRGDALDRVRFMIRARLGDGGLGRPAVGAS